jgi:toxin ParE1/3/4
VKVFITDAAIRDLMAIADYIRPDNPERATTFVNELLDRCETLAEFSARVPLVPRYESHGIRRCVYGDYLIFYRISVEQVEVIHILNGAQDYEGLLFLEE